MLPNGKYVNVRGADELPWRDEATPRAVGN